MRQPPRDVLLLAPVVRERAKTLAPAVLVALTFFIVAADPLGIEVSIPAALFSCGVLAVLTLLTLGLVTNRIAERHLHLASTAYLMLPALCTVVVLYTSKNAILGNVLVFQIASAGVLLHTPLVVGAVGGILLVAIPLLVRARGDHLAVDIALLVVAGAFAFLVHVLMRRALLRAEAHRGEAREAADALEKQLVELQRANTERTKLQEQLLHSQRMEAVGTLAAGLAHDMNNVMASISNLSALALAEARSPSLRADLEQIVAQTARGAGLTRGLLAFSRRGQYRKRAVRPDQIVRDVLPLLARTLPRSIEIRSELGLGAACVEGDATQLEQVLVNLALNANEAMDGTGTITICTDLTVTGQARLRVTDTGRGMDEATSLRAFEPFFTTKPIGQATGLGLSTVWGIVQAHGGTVEIDSELELGTTFTICLPLTTRQVASLPRKPVSAEPVLPRRLVLVVDDEPAVRSTTKRLLERMGLSVITAENGEDALARFAEHRDTVALVILDMAMPVMGGAACFGHLRAQSEVPVLIATGYAVEQEAQSLVAAGAALLEKPYTSAQLRQEVSRLLELELSRVSQPLLRPASSMC